MVVDLAAGDDRGPLVEQADQRADQPGLALPALAEQHDVVAGQHGALDLGQHRLVEADDAGEALLAAAAGARAGCPQLGFDGAGGRGRSRAAPRAWSAGGQRRSPGSQSSPLESYAPTSAHRIPETVQPARTFANSQNVLARHHRGNSRARRSQGSHRERRVHQLPPFRRRVRRCRHAVARPGRGDPRGSRSRGPARISASAPDLLGVFASGDSVEDLDQVGLARARAFRGERTSSDARRPGSAGRGRRCSASRASAPGPPCCRTWRCGSFTSR